MIRLSKIAAPAVLVANAAKWTSDLLAEIKAGGDKVELRKAKYRTPGIKDALKEETHRKCAYCESKPLHVTHGDIEHIVPKSEAPERTFDWQNLTLACDVCNTNKASKLGILDPYDCNPEEEFEFFGPMIFHRVGRTAAELTRIELDLNRTDLMERRGSVLQGLRDKFEKFELNPDAAARQLLRDAALAHETKPDREFAACARSFLK
jgi:HNH endonuclease